MTPNEQQRFREVTMSYLNHNAKFCQGCKRRRSIRQFAEGATVCKQCVLRGVK